MPAHVPIRTTVVPVSGCASTGVASNASSTPATPTAAALGGRAAVYTARARTSASFAASAGWTVDPPTDSHRCAPYSDWPTAATAMSSAAEPRYASAPNRGSSR